MIQKHSIEKANNLVGGNLNGSTPSFNHAIANIVKGVPVSHLNNNQRIEGINDMTTVFTPVRIYKVEKPTVKKYELPRLEEKE